MRRPASVAWSRSDQTGQIVEGFGPVGQGPRDHSKHTASSPRRVAVQPPLPSPSALRPSQVCAEAQPQEEQEEPHELLRGVDLAGE